MSIEAVRDETPIGVVVRIKKYVHYRRSRVMYPKPPLTPSVAAAASPPTHQRFMFPELNISPPLPTQEQWTDPDDTDTP
jgi:hypothetical protein